MEAITRKKGFLVGEKADDAKADGGWRKADMMLLAKVAMGLYLKKIDELDQVNRAREMTRDREDPGVLDADDEQVIEFRKSWIAQWSGNYGSFDDITKLSTLEFMLGEIVLSVEATVFVRIIDGSWPDGFHGQFAAGTSSIDHEKAILLDFGDDNVPVSDDGIMKLSRHAVSVEVSGELKVSFKAWQDGCSKVVEGEVVFTPARAGRSYGNLHFGSCNMEVLVAWSLISPDPEPDY
ncbi:unnamed protein product [Urochloa decumbens]|uniref:DUF6598 domain-containing protein n=1 Tax=Urochloa decumbens TaxID=240449 RepID=A0ABC9G0F3_9POAL